MGQRLCEGMESTGRGDFAGGHEKAGPGRARECGTDADAADAHAGKLRDGGEVAADEDIYRLGRNGAHDVVDVIEAANARRVKTIGTGVGILDEPPGGHGYVRLTDEKRLASR